jgi:hypothetical protein
MNEQRLHCDDTSPGNATLHRDNVSGQLMDRVIGKHTKRVSCRQYTQRPILRGRVVKMNTQGQHLRESARWGMRINDALFE